MATEISEQRDYNPLVLLLTGAIIVVVLFGGVPVAWLSKHGAEYGLGEMTWKLRELLQLLRPPV